MIFYCGESYVRNKTGSVEFESFPLGDGGHRSQGVPGGLLGGGSV